MSLSAEPAAGAFYKAVGQLASVPLGLVRRLSGAHVVIALLTAATLPWRKGVYYEGGADSVVVAKAALSLLALAVAVHLAGGARRILGVPSSPVLLVFAYLAITVIGGQAAGTLLPAVVVAARMAILTVTVTMLFSRYSVHEIIDAVVQVMGTIVALSVLTGLPSAARGRLSGGFPPVNPNELALLASVCLLYLFARMLQARETSRDLVAVGALLAVVLLTGSRTGLASLSIGAVVMTFRATLMNRRSFALVSLLAPALAYVAFGTDLLSSVFLRGGERGITTLSNRTIAWDAALNSSADPWESWFGAGLSRKKIEVPGQWWTTQLLDSSYISALVQGGLIGFAIVLLLCLSTGLRSLTMPMQAGPLWLGLTVFLSARAFLESGLFDSTTAFMVFFVTALSCRQPVRQPPGEPAGPGLPVASGAPAGSSGG